MENTNIKTWDYHKIVESFRSMGKEDIVDSAKINRTIWKEYIRQESQLELSGLEYEQTYSASTVAWLDMLNTLNLRRNWSEHIKHGFYFMVWVQVLIIPVLLMLMFIRPDITFEKIAPIIYVVIGENFIQIIWLVLVVVKFLFPPEASRMKING